MIKATLKRIVVTFSFFGIDLIKLIRSVRGLPSFATDYRVAKSQLATNDEWPVQMLPILDDKYKQGGMASGHYFHQDLLVARKIFQAKPQKHYDVGSRIDGFIAHLSTFMKVTIIDIRTLSSSIDNIAFLQADMMDVHENLHECCDSLSCLHALEHFGLGRYGDTVDVNGHRKGFDNLTKMLTAGGTLYFSVPIGKQRIEFNAHRVFSLKYLLGMFEEKYQITDFSYVNDSGDLISNATLDEQLIETNAGCEFGCGIFELQKK